MPYSEDEINAALDRVEAAKQKNPIGWGMLDELGLGPSEKLVNYAFANAYAHRERLDQETSKTVVYSTGWLQGLAVGHALGRGGE